MVDATISVVDSTTGIYGVYGVLEGRIVVYIEARVCMVGSTMRVKCTDKPGIAREEKNLPAKPPADFLKNGLLDTL